MPKETHHLLRAPLTKIQNINTPQHLVTDCANPSLKSTSKKNSLRSKNKQTNAIKPREASLHQTQQTPVPLSGMRDPKTDKNRNRRPRYPPSKPNKRLSSAPSRSPLRSQPRARPEPTQSPTASSLRDPRKTTSRDPTAQLSSPTRENPTELEFGGKFRVPQTFSLVKEHALRGDKSPQTLSVKKSWVEFNQYIFI